MKSLLVLPLLLAAAACSAETPATPGAPASPAAASKLEKIEPSADYPEKTCPVSGEPLGSMGKPIAYRYEGKEIQLCCGTCVKDFESDPAKYAAKVQSAPK